MPTIGPLHHHKPGTETGRLACSEQRSICLSVSTTHASFAGEVQWDVSAFVAGGLWYLEVRILPAQPTSRAFSGSLRAFGKWSGRRPEIRHGMAMLQREETLETPPQCERVRFPVVFLYRPVLGVTLADHADLPPIELQSW
jgi:hypothetical protein